MAHTIGHSQRLKPSRPANRPPKIPPNVRPITPMVPLASPNSWGDNHRPPAELGRIRNVTLILPNKASGKR